MKNTVKNIAHNTHKTGFTLIELVVVLAIIAILALMALPSQTHKLDQPRIAEAVQLASAYKADIEIFYRLHDRFPDDNEEAGLPQADQIIGNYMTRVDLDRGALHITLGNKVGQHLQGQTVSLQPLYIADVPKAPISWLCGLDTVPDGLAAAGDNLTSVERGSLPIDCR